MKVLLLLCMIMSGASFLAGPSASCRRVTAIGSKKNQQGGSWNPFQDMSDMMANVDDVIDDFLNKRMGNGEVFYGQRKYKPSGKENTEGNYNGMGMSDAAKIDMAREDKEERMERLEMRRLKEQGLKRDD
jgi:hypothetical protein